MLGKITRVVTRNLDKIIDINFYPVPETRYSNKLHRPIGIGVQGLADVFSMMKMSFDNSEAQLLNQQIFATIYYFSLLESNLLAKERLPGMKTIKAERDALAEPVPFTPANRHTQSTRTDQSRTLVDVSLRPIHIWKTSSATG